MMAWKTWSQLTRRQRARALRQNPGTWGPLWWWRRTWWGRWETGTYLDMPDDD